MNRKNYFEKFYAPGNRTPGKVLVAGARLHLVRKFAHLHLRSLFYLILLIAPVLFARCRDDKTQETAAANDSFYYTCSMHPQVMENHPGNCPLCGMKLIAVQKSATHISTQVRLSDEQIKLGNIRVDTIKYGSIGDRMILTGTLNLNQDKLYSVSARVEGRVEKLYFKNTGDYVHRGDKLYDLYSEQLNNAKQEYITALEQQNSVGSSLINYETLVDASKQKLLLWGMTNEQINTLGKTKQMSTLTSFYSTEEGYITSLNIKEGDYIMNGGTVLQLADLTTLWAEGQVYTTEMSSLDRAGNITVQVPGLNNQTISGKVEFINPEINPDTRIAIIRVTLNNSDHQLRPGMPVYIIANSTLRTSITLPVDAVLRDSKGSTVWVQVQPNVYEPRMVQVGNDDASAVEILSGLKPGDIVVTSGAYLINSEYIFEHGANPMAGMDMSNMKM